jgi:hypothetical protein
VAVVEDLGGDGEVGVGIEGDEVGVLAGFDGAGEVSDADELRGRGMSTGRAG